MWDGFIYQVARKEFTSHMSSSFNHLNLISYAFSCAYIATNSMILDDNSEHWDITLPMYVLVHAGT